MHKVDEGLKVAHIGAFSMPNWGDQLYPGVTKSLLDGAGINSDVSYFAPLEGTTGGDQRIRPLHETRSTGAELAIVGGGDLIRFDTRTVAMDHMSVPTSQRGSRLRRFSAKRFARKHFLPGPGVWVPRDGWLVERPATMLSVGVHTIPANREAREAICRYRAAWVRTQNGADRLSGAGIPRERIVVAPDMIFALPELMDVQSTREHGLEIFRDRLGFDEPPLVFQAAEFHGWPEERVTAVLTGLRGIPVTTLPLGSYAGEDRLLTAAGGPLGIPTLDGLRADEITAVLAAAGTVFTTSMHAAIVGASFGTPVVVPGIGKTSDAFAVLPEPPPLHHAEDSSLADVVTRLMGTRVEHSPDANRAAVVSAMRETLQAADLI